MAETTLNQHLMLVLRPLIRLLLHFGMSYDEFAELAKKAFVEAAQFDRHNPTRKQTTSRISTITGLSRKVVFKLLNQSTTYKPDSQPKLNRAARVINGWISDPVFWDAEGQPRALEMEQGSVNFSQLVKKYSGDITARTIVDELNRLEAIRQDDHGRLILIKKAYLPSQDNLEQFKLLCQNTAELIATIEFNSYQKNSENKRFQRKVYYDNIPAEVVPELKLQIAEKSQICLEEINKILIKYDRDLNRDSNQSQRFKLGLAIHYIEEQIDD